MKTCIKCGKEKPETDFRTYKIRRKTGYGDIRYYNQCRKCEAAYMRQYSKDNQPHKKPNVRKYQKEYRIKNADHLKDYDLNRLHGITLEKFNEMLVSQDGKCAICGSPNGQDGKKHFAVDHNHITGELRGILCHKCNMGIGHFDDDIALMTKAITYLKQFTPSPE